MQPIRTIESCTVVLPSTNIDTDQIIPARFLTTTTKEGLGKQAFADWRYDSSGAPKADFILNKPEAKDCAVLVAGRNFGCGSSREHAPWALLDYGFRAVISTEIADIFRNNSLKNGLLPIVVDETTHQWLLANPRARVRIDLEANTLSLPNGTVVSFAVEGFARYCLLNGTDELGFLLKQADAIARYEQRSASITSIR
jgi:3-isopropylmalate/(R)-2-methylmalate dehydratase small subunit